MIRLAAVLFGLAALAGAAGAQPSTARLTSTASEAERRLDVVYTVRGSMGAVGDFSVSMRLPEGAGPYEASARRRVTGAFRLMVGANQDYSYSVRGEVAEDGALKPSAYRHQGGRRADDRPNGRIVQAAFSADDVVTTTDPPGMGMGDPPASAEQRRGVVDQISAIAAMAAAPEGPCANSLSVYMDGRSRFDFIVSANGRVDVETGGYSGEVIRCRVRFRPIAGFSDPQEAADLTFLFAETEAGLYAPIRIQMPTNDVGVVTLEARSVRVNGEALQ